jgi:hypothetical protein
VSARAGQRRTEGASSGDELGAGGAELGSGVAARGRGATV